MAEYHLQKRTLSTWQHVTWYETEAEAKKNFDRAVASQTGYSWRYVKVETIEEHINGGEIELKADKEEATVEAPKQSNDGWSRPIKPGETWGEHKNVDPKPSHGLAGKVWLVNKTLREKKRVDPSEVDAMLAQGWEKGGPRTIV
jgi:hypothetical protein